MPPLANGQGGFRCTRVSPHGDIRSFRLSAAGEGCSPDLEREIGRFAPRNARNPMNPLRISLRVVARARNSHNRNERTDRDVKTQKQIRDKKQGTIRPSIIPAYKEHGQGVDEHSPAHPDQRKPMLEAENQDFRTCALSSGMLMSSPFCEMAFLTLRLLGKDAR